MNKSLVQKMMQPIIFILSLPFKLIRFFCLGLFFTSYGLIEFIVTVIGRITKYAFFGLLTVSHKVYLLMKVLLCTVLKIPVLLCHFIRYAYIGILVVSTHVYHLIKNMILFIFETFISSVRFISHAWLGFLVVSISTFHFLKYAVKGLKVPFIFFYNTIYQYRINRAKKKEEQRIRNEKLSEIHRLEQERLAELQRKKAEEYRKKREKDIYINENVKRKKKTFGDRIEDFILAISKFPEKIIKTIKDKIYNSSFAKDKRNQREIKRNILLLDFEGEDAKKSATKQLYEYEVTDANGKYKKGYFEAYSKVEVHSYLLSEGYTIYSIKTNKWIQRLHALEKTSQTKIKTKDLIFFLTQLSTYIKAGIPLVESLRILERQYRNKSYKRIFKVMIYDLTMGENFSTAMEQQGKAFPSLLINMVKTSEMTGDLPEVLDDMAEYYTEMDKTRKEMITAMTYPSIVLFVALAVTTFIMMFVIPKFVEIYESMDASQIPGITIAIMNFSAFLQKYFWFVLLGIIGFVALIIYCYRNVKSLRTSMQWLTMHLPVFGNIVIYNEVTMFTKTFASLLEHNVFITDCMDILNKITNNEVYHMLIRDTITNLAKGDKISTAFKGHWAFPIPAYEMLVTGEKTGELPQMMKKVSDYYQDLHRNSVTRIKTFMEPLLIIFLTVVVGIIVLAIVIPMFNMYNAIEKV